jgi:hypothetical protein
MVTTRRPVLPPKGYLAFAYLDGQFYWSDQTHPEISQFLIDHGYNHFDLRRALWGSIYNESDDEVPNYVAEMQSDHFGEIDEQTGNAMIDKLDALFPGITSRTPFSNEARVAQNDYQSVLDSNRGDDLAGLPASVKVPGHGQLNFGSHSELQGLAQSYMDQAGLPYNPPRTYATVDPNRAKRIADAYDQMPHQPDHPAVQQSYQAMINETKAQYDHLVNNGYKFEFYPQTDPYPNSPREAVLDLHNNRHMYVYPTSAGFGTGDLGNHPLLQDSGVRWNDQPVTHNDLFRAVHDVFGHAKEGVGFRADGEENAWRQHAAMYSQQARPAMTAETRGQNSWVNFGPHGQQNQNANQADTVYADQKAGLLPEWVMNDGAHDHVAKTTSVDGAFVYVPESDKIFFGSNHPDILRHMEERQDRADLNGNVYGWLFDGNTRAETLPWHRC